MIVLTREDGTVLALSSVLIESVTGKPPATVVDMAGGRRFVVTEPLEEIVALIHRDRAHDLSQAAAFAALAGTGHPSQWDEARTEAEDARIVPFRPRIAPADTH